jgi:hypothetical protein
MNEILDSIGNGQRKQALTQLDDSTYTMRELFDELETRRDYHEILVMFSIAQSQDYIKVKGE